MAEIKKAPAAVPAPVFEDEPIEEVAPVQPDVTGRTAGDDQRKMDSHYNATVRHLASQPKVKVRIPEPGEYVQINGWKWFIPAGRIEVPEQVAQILEEANRI